MNPRDPKGLPSGGGMMIGMGGPGPGAPPPPAMPPLGMVKATGGRGPGGMPPPGMEMEPDGDEGMGGPGMVVCPDCGGKFTLTPAAPPMPPEGMGEPSPGLAGAPPPTENGI